VAGIPWGWRGGLGFLSGAVVSFLYWRIVFSYQVFIDLSESICRVLGDPRTGRGWQGAVAYTIVISTPGLVASVLAATFLSRWSGSHPENETRCRKCGYILRGISEPRCPECGESI
jgi:RNA polymerase subunit RPABC4/transcription elongation factor Spt4